MSQNHIITINQVLINKINAKQDFSHSINDNSKRYIVGMKNLFTGKNPSLKYLLQYVYTKNFVDILCDSLKIRRTP